MAQHDKTISIPGGVAVLCGGPGAEREVSLISGEVAYQALIEAGIPAEKIEVPADDPHACLASLDCRVAVLMLHGEFGEDGTAQAILDHRGIAYTGSDARASALAMDKNAAKKLFVRAGIPTPRWAIASNPERGEAAVRMAGLEYPLFVKPNFRGSSVGVSKVERPDQLQAALEKALSLDVLAVIEEMVAGRELTIPWLAGRVLPVIELIAEGEFYDYRAKYISSGTRYLCPADLDPETLGNVESIVARAVEAIGVRDVGRVDIMLGAKGPMVLEMNTLPGFTSHSLLPTAAAKAGIGRPALCRMLVEMAARRRWSESGTERSCLSA